MKGNPCADAAEGKWACNLTLTIASRWKETQVLVFAAKFRPGAWLLLPSMGRCTIICSNLPSLLFRAVQTHWTCLFKLSTAALCCRSGEHPVKSVRWTFLRIFSSTCINVKVTEETGTSDLGKESQILSMQLRVYISGNRDVLKLCT